MNDYVPLNVRSTYSIGDSICQIPRLVRKAREMAFPAMALVDTNLCGAVEFHKSCRSKRLDYGLDFGGLPLIKPIIGLSVWIKERGVDAPLVLLAKNKRGYHHLARLASENAVQGRDGELVVPLDSVLKRSKGVICLAGSKEINLSETCFATFRSDFAFMAESDDDEFPDWEIANATGQSSCITTSTVRIGGSSKTIYWLNFHVKEEEVRQSDIVIAISDGSQVMWSYTIWITDYVPQDGRHGYDPDIDIADVEGTFNPQGGLVTFMPRNLGWVESGQTVGTTYAGESVFVRLKQQASDNFVVMHVARPEKTVVTGGDAGYSPYYCWGRKDPFIPSDGVNNGSNLGGLSGKYPTFQTVNDSGTIAKEYKQTILRPEVHLGFNSNWLHDQAGGNGFWCAGNTQTSVDKATVKTIYDPCPPGYTVPRYNAFLGLRIGTSGTTPNSYGGFTRGFYLWSHYRGSASESTNGMRYVFFSAAGYRSNQTGLTSKVNEYGGFWASIPNDDRYSEFLTISVDGTLNPQGRDLRSRGLSIRPTLDEYKN